jgi:myo-inositol-1(or 4)-monophosphatase
MPRRGDPVGVAEVDLQQMLLIASGAIRAAGVLVRNKLFSTFEIREKGNYADVVTELDELSEETIVNQIRRSFPDHQIVTEESGTLGSSSRWCWIIDPVDGTNNAIIGLPVLAIGITLCDELVPVLSAVYDPVSDRTWCAIRGQGAKDLHGRLVTDMRSHPRSRPLLAWIQGYGVRQDDQKAQALRLLLARSAHRMLDLWAPLPCWMMLVDGSIDGIVGYRIGEIDLHAGALIAAEAGLIITDFMGRPFVSRFGGEGGERCVVAGTPKRITELHNIIHSAGKLESRIADLWRE